MTQVVREELAHAAYRRRCRAGVNEVDGVFSWLLFKLLEVIQKVLTVAFPFRVVTSVTLESPIKDVN